MKLFLTTISFALALSLSAQTKSNQVSSPLTDASPSTVGVSEERLARIDNMLIEAIKNEEIPGVIALVARKGKIIYHKAFGIADVEEKRELKTDDIFRIASQTKAITSTAVMILWEQGKFRLDDPISKYIPEFGLAQILDSLYEDGTYTTTPADNQITIRHLLTHTSGIGYGVIDGDPRIRKIYADAGTTDLFTTEKITIEESIKKLAKLPLHHNPGEKFTYSEGLDVLGYFIEIVSGMPFDQYLREHLFDPLGMDDTWFYLPDSKHSRLVQVSELDDGKWKNQKRGLGFDNNYPIAGAKTFFSGGAGLSSTTKDYATFLQMYLNNGELNGTRILSRTTVQTIMANQIGDIWGDSGTYYGLAFAVKDQTGQNKGGEGSKGTFDWGGYFNTQYFADPHEQLIGILFKQTNGTIPDQTSWKFRQMVGQVIDN